MAQRFDDWEGEYLAHFRTKGSKNGVRRFQTESGAWTPLGLKERREREGWGEGNRKAAKYDRKYKKYAEKMNNARNDDEAAKYGKKASLYVAKRNTANGIISKKEYREIRAEDRREERQERREEKEYKRREAQERMAAYKEEQRKKNPKTMTDEELKAAIERKKMETEYKELNRSPLLKAGEKLVSGYMNYRVKKEEAAVAKKRMELDLKRIDADVVKSKERTKQTIQESKKAEAEAAKMKADVEGGLKYSRKADFQKAKTDYRNTTFRGNIARAIGARMNSGTKEKYTKIRAAEGQVAADRILKAPKDKAAKAAAAQAEKQRRAQEREAEKERRRKERLMRQYGYGIGGKLN